MTGARARWRHRRNLAGLMVLSVAQSLALFGRAAGSRLAQWWREECRAGDEWRRRLHGGGW